MTTDPKDHKDSAPEPDNRCGDEEYTEGVANPDVGLVAFYGHGKSAGAYAAFSNFYPCPFAFPHPNARQKLVFSCSEQAFMNQKALCFQDNASADKIMATSDPFKHKALGRKVANFDAATWDADSMGSMEWALWLKFSQNAELKQLLLETKDQVIAECTPKDSLWAVGESIGDAKKRYAAWQVAARKARAEGRPIVPLVWKGKNRLGRCLMNIRQRLVNDVNAKAKANTKGKPAGVVGVGLGISSKSKPIQHKAHAVRAVHEDDV